MLKQKLEITLGYEHFFSEVGCMKSVAISCRGDASNENGGVGFEQSEKTMRLRSEIVSRWHVLEKAKLVPIVHSHDLMFYPSRLDMRFWKLFVELDEANKAGTDQVSFLGCAISSIAEKHQNNRNSVAMVEEICCEVKKIGAAFMYWPFGTEFWSIGYLFASDLELYVDRIVAIANDEGVPTKKVIESELPVH